MCVKINIEEILEEDRTEYSRGTPEMSIIHMFTIHFCRVPLPAPLHNGLLPKHSILEKFGYTIPLVDMDLAIICLNFFTFKK